MSKIMRFSFFLRLLLILTFFAIPLNHINNTFIHNVNFLTLYTSHGQVDVPINTHLQLISFVLYLIPMTIQMVIVFYLIKLFGCYAKKRIFTQQSLKYIRNIGIALMAKEVTYPIIQAILSYLATSQAISLKKGIFISLSTQQYNNILIGLVTLIVAMIMYEAFKLKEENDSIV